jgi:hypothetical protein
MINPALPLSIIAIALICLGWRKRFAAVGVSVAPKTYGLRPSMAAETRKYCTAGLLCGRTESNLTMGAQPNRSNPFCPKASQQTISAEPSRARKPPSPFAELGRWWLNCIRGADKRARRFTFLQPATKPMYQIGKGWV